MQSGWGGGGGRKMMIRMVPVDWPGLEISFPMVSSTAAALEPKSPLVCEGLTMDPGRKFAAKPRSLTLYF